LGLPQNRIVAGLGAVLVVAGLITYERERRLGP
jgi:hypothetical protein